MNRWPSFEQYLASVSAVSAAPVAADPEALELCQRATERIHSARPLDVTRLAAVLETDPGIAPVLAAAAGLSQERFRSWLSTHFGTGGWRTLSRTRATDLASLLESELGLLTVLEAEADRHWTWADVLARTMSSRQRATSAVRQGRHLEDQVEAAIRSVGLPFVPRTRFQGRQGSSSPVDFAVPAGGSNTQIAIGVKGFDSTGSKLTDARREIEEMAKVRLPRQYIYAVVDGQGWIRRQSDLLSIHQLWVDREIDGLYNQSSMGELTLSLAEAGERLGL